MPTTSGARMVTESVPRSSAHGPASHPSQHLHIGKRCSCIHLRVLRGGQCCISLQQATGFLYVISYRYIWFESGMTMAPD